MRILVLGGSWFVGAAVVRAAAVAGHEVTVFNRGHTPSTYPDGVRVVHGDRTDRRDLERLAASGPWDVAVDVAGSVPVQIRDAARVLEPVCGRFVLVSTVSVYRQWPDEPVSETSEVYPAAPDAEGAPAGTSGPVAYGMLKSGCEAAAVREFGAARTLVLRPSVVLGPGEYVGRLPWWLERMRRGGRVLAPGRAERIVQPVDVEDLALFLLHGAEAGIGGTLNVAMPQGSATFGELVSACARVSGSTAEVQWVDEQWLVSQGVRQWTEIPLWRPQPGTWAVDTRRAETAGLHCRPLSQTVERVWSWWEAGGRPVSHPRWDDHGIAPERETALLAAWDAAREQGRLA